MAPMPAKAAHVPRCCWSRTGTWLSVGIVYSWNCICGGPAFWSGCIVGSPNARTRSMRSKALVFTLRRTRAVALIRSMAPCDGENREGSSVDAPVPDARASTSITESMSARGAAAEVACRWTNAFCPVRSSGEVRVPPRLSRTLSRSQLATPIDSEARATPNAMRRALRRARGNRPCVMMASVPSMRHVQRNRSDRRTRVVRYSRRGP